MGFNRVALLLLFFFICSASANYDNFHGRDHNHHGRKHHHRGYHVRPPTEPPVESPTIPPAADAPPVKHHTETPTLPPVYPPTEFPIEGPFPSSDYPPVMAPSMTPISDPDPYDTPDDPKHHHRGYHVHPPTGPPAADAPPVKCHTETPTLPPVYLPIESPIEGPYPSFDYNPPVLTPSTTPIYGPAPYEIPDDSNFMPIPEDDPRPSPPPVNPDPNQQPWAVQGVVYCKSCNTTGIDTLSGASPLAGARVFLACRNGRSILSAEEAITDTNGYFFVMHTYNYDASICDVTLYPSAPKNSPCKKQSTLNGGSPAKLEPENASYSSYPFVLYTVGPLAYEPLKKC